MKIKIILACLFFTLSLNAISAEEPDWFKLAIKSPNPNDLAYYANADEDCPINSSAISNIVEGVFTRSRIKPSSRFYEKNRVYLNVLLDCLERGDAHPVFVFTIQFGKYKPVPILFDRPYSVFGIGDKESMSQALKTKTEDAITDYLKINFDL
jgi:hypothetical protein